MSEAAVASAAPPPHKRWLRRLVVALLIVVALVAALVIVAALFISSQSGVDLAVREMIARSDGRLEVDGATGSLLDTVRIKHLVWRGPGATTTAEDVALTWSPSALWSRRVAVRTFVTRLLTIDVKPSDTPLQLPVTLTLPMEIAIDRVSVEQIDWQVGENRGTIHGIEFAYAGGAVEHRVAHLSLVSQYGTVAGDAVMKATPPYGVNGALHLAGAGELQDIEGDVRLSGNLAGLAVESAGHIRDSMFALRTTVTPFAPVLVHEFALDAGNVDLARWNGKLPQTRIAVKANARLIDGGVAGTFEATNAIAGALDASRVPLRSLSSRFSWHADALVLDDIDALFDGSGHATGRAVVPLKRQGAAGKWSLTLRDIDLHHIYGRLNATHLAGTIDADLDAAKPRVSGDIADRKIAGGIALAFAATVDGAVIEAEHFRARAGPGEVEGSGRIALDGERAFKLAATSKHFDPSRVGNFPAGNLVGTIAASGVLAPAWRVDGAIVIAPGSRIAGTAVTGTARGIVTRETVRDGAVDLQIGSAKLTAMGNIGRADDRITVELDAPRLADVATLLSAKGVPAMRGAIHARADLRGLLTQAGIDGEVHGEALKIGSAFAAQRVDARIAIAPTTAGTSASDFASRAIALDIDASNLAVAADVFAAVHAKVDGTLAQHTIALGIRADDLDADATAHGGLADANTRDLARLVWQGSLDTLQNRGPFPLRLASPATLAVSHQHVRVGEMQVAIADGSLHVADFAWDEGRIATHGNFTAVPVTSVTRLAGVTLPFTTDIKMGGQWSLAATPRLSGTLHIEREEGDIRLSQRDATGDNKGVSLGVTSIALDARIDNDAIDATGNFRSSRGGSAEAKATIGATAGAPLGHIAANAPLTLAVNADLPTLQLLQPWIGTVAVIDGRARADITGRGTLEQPLLTGTVSGENLRVEAPQYGVHLHDGKLVAHLAERQLVLDELVASGGDGQFRASGTLVSAADGKLPSQAHLTWRADNFRLFNKPDLKLIVDGEGTVSTTDGKLALNGKLRAREGRVVYVSDSVSALGDDVVVKGWQKPPKPSLRGTKLPLAVDLALDFGDKLTFSGEGLETGLLGVVHITTVNSGGFNAKGSIRAVNGTYFAFGQKLVIDRGQLIFDGPLDNPALDIVALRKNLAVEAGVAVTGTIKVPIIQLTSNPPMPDGEKLSWLVMGQGLDRASSADIAALQAASAVLLGRNSKPIGTRIAQSFGLDDISIKSATGVPRGASRSSSDVSGQVVTVGKRLSDKLSLIYEQGLTIATNALRLEYSVSRTLTLRAEAGSVSGLGIYYRKNFD